MARCENLAIYRKAVELMVYIENAVRNFPKHYAFAIGADLYYPSRIRKRAAINEKLLLEGENL